MSLVVLVVIAVQAYIYSGQWKVMRQLGEQNERLIKASEDNADAAREAFRVGSAPYFGIPDITLDDFIYGSAPQAKILFVNGGKTPAWRIHTFVKFVFGETPDDGDSWEMVLRFQGMVHTFLPAGQSQEFRYAQNGFHYTHARETEVNAGTKFLFVVAEVHYRDFRERWHSRIFRAVWSPQAGGGHFHDYDASSRNCQRCKKKGYSDN